MGLAPFRRRLAQAALNVGRSGGPHVRRQNPRQGGGLLNGKTFGSAGR
jgi:hypothetical protein